MMIALHKINHNISNIYNILLNSIQHNKQQSYTGPSSILMYPPKRDSGSTSRNKLNFVSPQNGNSHTSPTNSASRDINKINKILESARTYQKDKDTKDTKDTKDKQTKRDYMQQGISNLNKKNSGPSLQSKIGIQVNNQRKQTINNDQQNTQNPRNRGIYTTNNNEDSNKSNSSKSRSRSKQQKIKGNTVGSQIARLKNRFVSNSKGTTNVKQQIKTEQFKYVTSNIETENNLSHLEFIPQQSTRRYSGKEGNIGNQVKNKKDSEIHVKQTQSHYVPAQPQQRPALATSANKQSNRYIPSYPQSNSQISQSSSPSLASPSNQYQTQPSYISSNNPPQRLQQISPPKKPSHSQQRSSIDPSMLVQRQNQNIIVSLKSKIEQTQQQLTDMRNKFYKSEQGRLNSLQRLKAYELQLSSTRKQNQTYRIQLINIQNKLKQKDTILTNYNQNKSLNNQQKQSTIKQLQYKLHAANQQTFQKINTIRHLSNQVKEYEGNKQRQQNQIFRLNQVLANGDENYFKIRDEYERHIDKLQNQINQLIQNKNKMGLSNEEEVQLQRLRQQGKNNKQLKKQLKNLQEHFNKNQIIKNNLQNQLQEKNMLIGHLKSNSDANMDDLRVQTLQQQLLNAHQQKKIIVTNYQSKILKGSQKIQKLQQELQLLKKYGNQNDNKTRNPYNKFVALDPQQQSIQQILNTQTTQMNNLRETNTKKTYQNLTLQSQLQKLQVLTKNLSTQKQILQKQLNSLKKNNHDSNENNWKRTQNQIQNQNKKNEIAQQQITYYKNQISNKDNFIQNYLTGVVKGESVDKVLKQLDRILNK